MLRTVRPGRLGRIGGGLLKTRVVANAGASRFNSTDKSKPEEVFTKINDSADPQRNAFFQYTWGSWLKNDKLERKRRETKFSIEGVLSLLETLNSIENNSNTSIEPPKLLDDGSFVLKNNLDLLGEGSKKIKTIASIHEGKHNRVYKITLENDKEFVLRIPYYLEQAYSTSLMIKSEVATLDFLNLKLNAKVPKVVSYGFDRENALKSPFILMEYVSGDLLMKKWDPLNASKDAESKLKEVIDPIVDFYTDLLSVSFNKSGSLYFYNDVDADLQKDVPYENESDETLANRWRIGPTTERIYHKGKFRMSKNSLLPHLGPFNEVSQVLKSVAELQKDYIKHRIGQVEADAGEVASKEDLQKQIDAFDEYIKIAPLLLNPTSKAIVNVEESIKPRLFFPDLDPLNVIVNDTKGPVFVDFENTLIKPFLLHSYPSFIAYNGAKVFNIEEDIPDFESLDELEKQQIQFMYAKTRNERLWELGLNGKRHDLISIASPHIKILKLPYSQLLELKTDKDYLYLINSLIQLEPMWEAYVTNDLIASDETKFPIEFSEDKLLEHENLLDEHQKELVSTPFAATGGWIPQDMFVQLKSQGIIVEDSDGNYKIETEKILERTEEEEKAAAEAEAEALAVMEETKK